MRIALLTEGGYPYPGGDAAAWCDRLVRGLDGDEFEVYALGRHPGQLDDVLREIRHTLPGNVRRVRTVPLWGPAPGGPGARGRYGRRGRRRFGEHFAELAGAVCAARRDVWPATEADRFAAGLHGLAALALEHGGLSAVLRSEQAVRLLECACRAPGARRAAREVPPAGLLTVTDRLERALRPLSPDWYGGGPGPAGADVCHAVGGGCAALPGLLAGRLHGTPLLVTEYTEHGVRLREHCLAGAARAAAPDARPADLPVRALLTSFRALLAHETYRRAELVVSGNAHARRWQLRCGADRDRLRTVHPGMDAAPFTAVGEDTGRERPVPVLVWTGRIEPARDLACLLRAFAEVRRALPRARLLVAERPGGPGAPAGEELAVAAYRAHCRLLADDLLPAAPDGSGGAEGPPVRFARVGDPQLPTAADAYAAADVAVFSSVVAGFPAELVEAMLAGRATVATDAGAVREVVGGTGLVVPPHDPRALADACAALLGDPARRARLGAAARARALELFTAERNVAAFRGLHLEVLSRRTVPAGRAGGAHGGAARPFARPAEARLPGRWAARAGAGSGPAAPRPAVPGQARPGGRPGRAPGWARTPAGPGEPEEGRR
ncbi:DUF3492 domain-containing protein [Streptomyces sp. TRM 70361]|uniref:DUF3492 domain-containing protein n=1 Tax=Streptomyces sp. TRM 70361 TaxID=3116553 RepID=UPI002E7BA2D8|nr:DUF3492 domain-containing protein [Streptomyces sp. TRM 70361]MEE1939176.1 DUF3492 domain-containing protein [Streptomyces sp. TRM 70361]